MPRHQRVTPCLKNGGPLSDHCPCEHCTLSLGRRYCPVCGASEGGLTTDCPGSKVDLDKQKEVYETSLDYTDERGWHLGASWSRAPRFETTLLPEATQAPRVDPRSIVAPSIDWVTVDRHVHLQHELAQKAIAWALADRAAEDSSAICTRLEDELDARRNEHTSTAAIARGELQAQLKPATIDFQLANKRAERCDEEFRQAAKMLVVALETSQAVPKSDEMLFTRTCGCTVVAGAACPHFVAARSDR